MSDFRLPTLDGQHWTLSQHRGHVVLLIDRQGRVADASAGALDEGSARRELERLLKEPSGKSRQ